MDYPDIFAATLGLYEPWLITNVSFAAEENRLDITILYPLADSLKCPLCGSENKISYISEEVWFHSDFFRHATYLHTKVPFFHCCKVQSVERPWSRPGSRFSQTSEKTLSLPNLEINLH